MNRLFRQEGGIDRMDELSEYILWYELKYRKIYAQKRF